MGEIKYTLPIVYFYFSKLKKPYKIAMLECAVPGSVITHTLITVNVNGI
jgi:hypothetical protein